MKSDIPVFGYANIIGGLLLLAFWYLYAILLPYNQLDTTLSLLVKHRNWVLVNVLGVSGSIVALVGLVGIYIYSKGNISNLGHFGFLLAFIGTVLLTGALLWDTIIWPILANHDASLLDFQGPIYQSRTFVPFFVTSGAAYSLGYILFGIAIAQSGIFPLWTGWFLAIGGPLFGLGAIFGKLQVYPRTLGITLFAIGMIWIGLIMRRG